MLTPVHLGNALFTVVFGRLGFHCGSLPVLRDICSPGKGGNVIKVTHGKLCVLLKVLVKVLIFLYYLQVFCRVQALIASVIVAKN